LTGLDPTGHRDTATLITWTVRARMPYVLGPGRRSRRPIHPDDACHAIEGVEAPASPCVPAESLACQPCVPTEGASGRWRPARQRLADLVARARRYADALRTGRHRTQQQLAEAEGLTQSYVSQILGLLRLPAPLLDVACDPDRDEPVPALPDLLEIARVQEPRAQVLRYRAVIARLQGRDNGVKARQVKVRGFQHLFAEARALQAALDRNEARSLTDLGMLRGISHHRVSQLLDLLTLPPDVQAALDVPADQVAHGLTQKEVRRIAKLRDAAAQREAMQGWTGGLAAK